MTSVDPPTSATGQEVLSAFRAVYLFAFAFAIFKVILLGITDAQRTVPKVGLSEVDSRIWTVLVTVFLAAVCFHLARIYVTLERLEKQKFPFVGFYSGFSARGLWVEFAVRVAVVGIVTLKAVSPTTEVFPHMLEPSNETGVYDTLPIFLIILYFALLMWGVVACFAGKKSTKEAFLLSSASGLMGSIAIYLVLAHHNNLVLPSTIALFIFSGCLLYDVLFRSNWFDYARSFL